MILLSLSPVRSSCFQGGLFYKFLILGFGFWIAAVWKVIPGF
jgi:hypothetical protein